MNSSIELFKNRLEKINVSLSDEQMKAFDTFYDLLVEKNKYMNLTAIIEYDDVLLKHFIDCLSVNIVPEFVEMTKNNALVIDVGTGAGFPGIPLKIAFPSLNLSLLDSLNKRINFLNEVIDELKLNDIGTFHGRAEDYAVKTEFREKYDLCVSRAVANLSTLSEYCLPFIRQGGYFIALKSGDIDEELSQSKNAITLLGGSLENVIPFTLPMSDIERSFVVIKKNKNTPKKYPRKAGLPSKEPLK